MDKAVDAYRKHLGGFKSSEAVLCEQLDPLDSDLYAEYLALLEGHYRMFKNISRQVDVHVVNLTKINSDLVVIEELMNGKGKR